MASLPSTVSSSSSHTNNKPTVPVPPNGKKRQLEPYSALGINFEEAADLPDWQRASAIYQAAFKQQCRLRYTPSLDDDNPQSPFHRRIQEIYWAKEILLDEKLRPKLDACLTNLYYSIVVNAQTVCGVVDYYATEDEIREAKDASIAEWQMYGSLATVMIAYISRAYHHLLNDLRQREAATAAAAAAEESSSEESSVDSPNDSVISTIE